MKISENQGSALDIGHITSVSCFYERNVKPAYPFLLKAETCNNKSMPPPPGAEKNNVPHVACAGVFIKASGADGGRKNQKVIEGIKRKLLSTSEV